MKNYLIIYLYLLIFLYNSLNNKKLFSFAKYKHYLNDCRNLKKYNRNKIINYTPYISICLPSFNMENYIEKVILSISFPLIIIIFSS